MRNSYYFPHTQITLKQIHVCAKVDICVSSNQTWNASALSSLFFLTYLRSLFLCPIFAIVSSVLSLPCLCFFCLVFPPSIFSLLLLLSSLWSFFNWIVLAYSLPLKRLLLCVCASSFCGVFRILFFFFFCFVFEPFPSAGLMFAPSKTVKQIQLPLNVDPRTWKLALLSVLSMHNNIYNHILT